MVIYFQMIADEDTLFSNNYRWRYIIFKWLYAAIQCDCCLFLKNLELWWSLIFKRFCTMILCDGCLFSNNCRWWSYFRMTTYYISM